MIILFLGHSIVYVPNNTLIQCMDDMALMPKNDIMSSWMIEKDAEGEEPLCSVQA